MNSEFLAALAESSRARVAKSKGLFRLERMLELAAEAPAPPPLSLHERFDLIAEVKLRSPAAGRLAPEFHDMLGRTHAYAIGGAAAVSVLTEPTEFEGTFSDLAVAASLLRPHGVPTMRNDFLVDPYQLVEARVAGAAGALVVLRLLRRPELESLVVVAHSLDLFLLLEAADERDLRVASQVIDELGPEQLLVGVNCRDLKTLRIVPQRLLRLAEFLPQSVPCVASGGIATSGDIRRVVNAGYRLALVGTALMQSHDPGVLVREMVDAGRSA